MPLNAIRHVGQQQRIATPVCSGPAFVWFRVSSDDSRTHHTLACDHALSLYLCNLFSGQRSKEAKKKKPDVRLITPSSVDFLCCRFRNKIVFTEQDC